MNRIKEIFLICLFVFIQVTKCAKILILHPLYAGSHELTLRSIGNHLIKERGHSVTQVMFQHTNMNISLSSDTENKVDIIPLRIRDPKKECTQYINKDGQFDIGSFSIASFLWESGDKLWHFPTDLFCVTRVHCNMILNDPIFFESLNKSHYDIGIKSFIDVTFIFFVTILLLLSLLAFVLVKNLLYILVYYSYILILLSIASFVIFILSIALIGITIAYFYFHIASMKKLRFLII